MNKMCSLLMEECELIILVYACYTKEKYKNQIKCVNNTWGEEYKNIKF